MLLSFIAQNGRDSAARISDLGEGRGVGDENKKFFGGTIE
jgi:hypothetical protein